MLHAKHISSLLILSPHYLRKNANYKVSHFSSVYSYSKIIVSWDVMPFSLVDRFLLKTLAPMYQTTSQKTVILSYCHGNHESLFVLPLLSVTVRNKLSHPHKTMGKIIVYVF